MEINATQKKGEYHPSTIILVVFLIYAIINFGVGIQNREENIKYNQDRTDDYDSFYQDCMLYFTENKSTEGVEVIRDCKKLELFSKKESKEIIFDLENPSKESLPDKDCDIRGCVYSN